MAQGVVAADSTSGAAPPLLVPNGMSDLTTAAARTLTVGFFGTTLSDPLKLLLDRGVGGVVLFARNVEDPAQVGELARSIKAHAGRPVMIGLDQEGGLVQRLRKGFTRLPPMRALGAVGDAVVAEEVGRLIGQELAAVGIDVNYAPVLDVDTNPKNPIIGNRSLGRDAALVARLGVALGRGIESAGVASCGKHFPGHGDTEQDSHQELPRLSHDRARLDRVELVPFRAWSEAKLASIMTAHVIFEPIDAEFPATMSRRVLCGILREELGYEGLIITDDIEMKAIADHYGYDVAAKRGIASGVDNFLCCHTAEVAHGLIDTLAAAAASGEVPEARLRDAAARVESFNARWAKPARAPRLELVGTDAGAQLIERVLTSVDPKSAELGEDPTEIMEKIRVERERARLGLA